MSEGRVLFACDLDSQVFGALPLAVAFQNRGWNARFAIDQGLALPASVRERLAGRFEVEERPLCALATEEKTFENQAVGVFATGSRIALFRHVIELAGRVHGKPRPALFSGFNGLVYEKFEEGAAWRLGLDQLCLNGPRDEAAFKTFVMAPSAETQPYVITGLRRAAPSAEAPKADRPKRPLFVFAEQVAAPSELSDRRRLATLLARLARDSQNWDVAIKARIRPNEVTFHGQTGHIERLVAGLSDKPANLSVVYEPLDALLARASLFATLSSTALFDALDHGVPGLVVSDFGVKNAYGSHVFVASGLMTRLAQLKSLDEAPRPAPDPAWLEQIGYGDTASPDALVDRIERHKPGGPLPPAFYSFEDAATSAGPYERHTAGVLAARAKAEDALTREDGAAARAALAQMGVALAEADRQRAVDSAWRLHEGWLAASARKAGLYWAYKRARTKIFGETPPRANN